MNTGDWTCPTCGKQNGSACPFCSGKPPWHGTKYAPYTPQGWACPKCGVIYPPWVPSCLCSVQMTIKTNMGDTK